MNGIRTAGNASPIRASSARALILLSPSGAGKDTIITGLQERGIATPCRRDTTRPPRPGENGFYSHISLDEFQERKARGEYLMPIEYAGHWFGVPVAEVVRSWKASEVPVLKGTVHDLPGTKEQMRRIRPDCTIVTVWLLTDPEEAWIEVLRNRGCDDTEQRIQGSRKELELARVALRPHIDHFIINRFGDVVRTIDEVEGLICTPV